MPFFGQGANAAFEDCISLRNALERYPGDPARAFSAYEAERAPNADAIADLAIANFHEMRDHVASPLFRLEKRGEVLLHRLLPNWFIPLYTMISFTRIPYAEARARPPGNGWHCEQRYLDCWPLLPWSGMCSSGLVSRFVHR